MGSVSVWTGRTACALQAALRLSNESFAEHLGIAVRTVAAWHQKPTLKPKSEMQQLLDTAPRASISGGHSPIHPVSRRIRRHAEHALKPTAYTGSAAHSAVSTYLHQRRERCHGRCPPEAAHRPAYRRRAGLARPKRRPNTGCQQGSRGLRTQCHLA
jgi:hypothetical protein